MRLERLGERNHGVADVVMLLAVVCLALATWSYLGDAATLPLWRSYASVALAGLLALAALTRQPHWATSMRFLTGAWTIAAPYLLEFAHIAPAFRAYMAIGALLLTTASISGTATSRLHSPLPTAQPS